MSKSKTHIISFSSNIGAKTLCGIPDRDGIAFDETKKITCKKCKKLFIKIIKK